MVSRHFAPFFGEAVRRERKAQKLSQEKLAEKSDLSMRTISLVECGERNLSVDVAASIAHGLAVPLWRLIKEAEGFQRRAPTVKR